MAPRTSSSEPLPEVGSLGTIGIGSLIRRAALERKSAILTVTGDRVSKVFLFEHGLVRGSRSNLPTESLARLLVVRGKASRTDVEALGVNLLDDQQVVEAVLIRGLVKDHDLEEVLRYQLLLRLADVFSHPTWTFAWTAAQPLPPNVEVNAYQIFTEGLARQVTRENLAGKTADLRERVPVPDPGSVFQLALGTLPARARQLHEAMDRKRTFAALAALGLDRASGEQRAEGEYRSWIYLLAFLEAGYLVFAEEAASASGSDNEKITVFTSGGVAVSYTEIDDPHFTDRYEVMCKQNLFEILNVTAEASDRDVKKAYFKLAKEFHPDKLYNHQERTVKKYSDKLFALVNRAYDELRTSEGRATYAKRQQEIIDGVDIESEAKALLKSEAEFQKGVVFYRKRDFNSALGHFEAALKLNPNEPDHHVFLGWIKFQIGFPADTEVSQAALGHIAKGVEMAPKHVDGNLFLAQVHKVMGDADKAETLFKKVLALRPHHVEAQRELRLMEQRRLREASNPQKGRNKLFK